MRNKIVDSRWFACAALALASLLASLPAEAQSGRGGLHGWVAFDGVAYVEQQPRAKVELVATTPGNHGSYHTETDEHGFYHFDGISLGEFRLRISAPHFAPYETDIYIPSDFIGNWATLLKSAKGDKVPAHEKKRTPQ